MILTDIITCEKGLHFPERVYYWPLMGSYYAHCAICGTDYRVTTEKKAEKKVRR